MVSALCLVFAGACGRVVVDHTHDLPIDAPNTSDAGIDALATFGVGVTVEGMGTVVSGPSGIDCGATCTARWPAGTLVRLSAVAAPNWVFTGWSGDCAGTAACDLDVTADRAVTATFAPAPRRLTLVVQEANTCNGALGTVTATPAGFSCTNNGVASRTCTGTFPHGTTVNLAATVVGTNYFVHYLGDCATTTASCSVAMTADRSVTAEFCYLIQ